MKTTSDATYPNTSSHLQYDDDTAAAQVHTNHMCIRIFKGALVTSLPLKTRHSVTWHFCVETHFVKYRLSVKIGRVILETDWCRQDMLFSLSSQWACRH